MTQKTTNDILINVRIPKELHEKLKFIAGTQLMPMSVAIRTALLKYAEDMSRHAFYNSLTPEQKHDKQKRQVRIPTQGMYPTGNDMNPDDDWL